MLIIFSAKIIFDTGNDSWVFMGKWEIISSSSLLWPLSVIRWWFPATGMERKISGCDSCAAPFSSEKLSYSQPPWLLLVWGTCFMFHWADRRTKHFPCAERKPWWLGSWGWNFPLTCQFCQRVTWVVKVAAEGADGRALLLASWEVM